MASKQQIAKRYTDALFTVAQESDALEKVEADLEGISTVLASNKEVEKFLTSEVLPNKMQTPFLESLIKTAKLNDLTQNLLKVLLKNNRLFTLPVIIELFGKKLKEHKGIVVVKATTAIKLDKASNDNLIKDLKEALGGKVELENEVNKEVLGGVVLKIGSQMLDASLSTKLKQIEQNMRSAKV